MESNSLLMTNSIADEASQNQVLVGIEVEKIKQEAEKWQSLTCQSTIMTSLLV